MASSVNPSTYGQSVTFTATISNGATGAITFLDGGASIGSGTISGSTATFTTSSLSTGSHSITASYTGDANWGATTSTAVTQNVTQAVPSAPSGIVATPAANGTSVTLAWTDNANNETSYTVERCLGPGCATFSILSSNVPANSITYTDFNTAVGTVYRFRVKATNAAGSSPYATTGDVTTPSAAFTPVIIGATAGANGTTATVTWSDVANETSYYVERCTGTSCATGFAGVGNSLAANTTSFSDSGLNPGATYGYRLRAYNPVGYSGYSSTAYVTAELSSVSIVLASSENPSSYGHSVFFTATVPGATGTVTFKDGSTVVGTSSLSNGIASYATEALIRGTHSFVAIYNGDSTHNPATSVPITQVVVNDSEPCEL